MRRKNTFIYSNAQQRKEWHWPGTLRECSPDVLGCPGPLVTRHHLPVSRSRFLALGIGALGVTAEVRANLTF